MEKKLKSYSLVDKNRPQLNGNNLISPAVPRTMRNYVFTIYQFKPKLPQKNHSPTTEQAPEKEKILPIELMGGECS